MKKTCLGLMLLGVFISGCGSKSSSPKSNPSGLPGTLEMGVSNEAEVEAELGEPDSEYTTQGSKVLEYGETSFQISGSKLDGYFRNPKEDEVHLQYWLHKWKNAKTLESPMNETKNNHGQYDYQMNNSEEHTTIIYNRDNGRVKKVMYYGK